MLRTIFTFDSFILPKIATVVYWVGLALIALLSVFGPFLMLGMSFQAVAMGYGPPPWLFAFAFLLSLLVGAVSALLWRVLMEVWIEQFSIHDVLRTIRDQRG